MRPENELMACQNKEHYDYDTKEILIVIKLYDSIS